MAISHPSTNAIWPQSVRSLRFYVVRLCPQFAAPVFEMLQLLYVPALTENFCALRTLPDQVICARKRHHGPGHDQPSTPI